MTTKNNYHLDEAFGMVIWMHLAQIIALWLVKIQVTGGGAFHSELVGERLGK